MDTVTHTLFGLTLYGAINKENMERSERRALLAATLVGSQIPDIDVISSWWDVHGRYQMWHRGVTHSVFVAPIWAALIGGLCRNIFKTGRISYLYIIGLTLIAVLIHITSDIFNAWGTGYFEPLSSVRLTLGTTSIIDFVVWLLIGGGFAFARLWRKKVNLHRCLRIVWVLIALQFASQGVQGAIVVAQHRDMFEQITLAASFVPGNYQVVGRNDSMVGIYEANAFGKWRLTHQFDSANVNRARLFELNPRAATLVEWAPIVVYYENDSEIGVFDPRFYRNGTSFLSERIGK